MPSGADIAKAYVQIIPSADGIKGKLSELMGGEADAAGKSAGGKFSSALGGVLKTGGVVVGAMATATAALTGTLVSAAGKTAEFGDNIDKMSQKMGLSATAYQEWDAIMRHSGTSIDTMQAGMKTLANAVENNNEAFQRLGITQEQIASMNNEELFAATITALQNVENETERTYLAGQLLGRGATELGALLNMSADETEAMRQRVHELGGVMSDEAVKAAARYQDSLQDMQTAFRSISRNMMAEFLPAISTVMDGLTELFSGGDGIGKISEGINDLTNKISAAAPKMLKVGGQIIMSLGDAIIQNLPLIVEQSVPILMALADGILQNLPMLVDAALQIIVMLASGLSDSLPKMIPQIVDIIFQIVDTLISNADLLVDAAIEIIIALAEGLIEALPRLLEKAPELIIKLNMAIIENAPKLLEAAWEIIKMVGQGILNHIGEMLSKGREIVQKVKDGVLGAVGSLASAGMNIVKGIWSGISNGLGWIKGKISGWVGNVTDFIKGLFGIHSPSTVMRDQVGVFLAKGIGEGFAKEMPNVEKLMQDTMPNLTSDISVSKKFGYSTAESSDGNLAAEIRALREDVRNLKIYLDTGILVGAVDAGLQTRAMTMERRALA